MREQAVAAARTAMEAIAAIPVEAIKAAQALTEVQLLPVRLFSCKQLQALFAVSDETIRKLMRGGELPVVHLGGSVRVRGADVLHFVERLVELERLRDQAYILQRLQSLPLRARWSGEGCCVLRIDIPQPSNI